MTSMQTPDNQIMSEKTLYDVLRDVWRAKFWMLGFVIIMTIAAFVFLSVANDFYRAEMIIAPASPMGQSLQKAGDMGEGSTQLGEEDFQSNAAFLRFENTYNGASVANFLVRDKEIITGLALDRTFEFSENLEKWNAENLSE